MKKYKILIIAVLVLFINNSNIVGQLIINDDFESYTTGSLNGQGNWVDMLAGIEVHDNGGDKVVYSNSRAVAAIRLNQTFNPDQSAKMTFEVSTQPTRFLGPAVRCSGSGTTTNFYAFVASTGQSNLVKIVNGTWVQIGTDGPGLNIGDIMEIRAQGTTLSIFVNDQPFTNIVTNGQTTDETLTSGSPGIAGHLPGTYTLGDNWVGAELNQQNCTTGVDQQEFEALVDLYNSTDGANWTNNSGWDLTLTACDVSNSWHGVTVENGHVTNLQLPDNNLVGNIPASITNFTYIQTLNLSQNQLSGAFPSENISNFSNLTMFSIQENALTDMPDISEIANLTLASLQDNAFTFKDIIPYVGVSTYTYAPQAKVGQPQTIDVTSGASQTISVLVEEQGNTYQWYKNEIAITGANESTLTINNFATTDNGIYHCAITNSQAVLLTLLSEDITLSETICQTGVSQQELDALVALYNATDGNNWTNNSGWDINASPCDVDNDWFGVTVENGHVTYLYLQDNNLNGVIPSEIGNLSWLIRFYAYNNNLTGSIPPEIGTLSNLRVVNLYNNVLDGAIPDEFYNLTELTGIQIFNNNLSGSISPLIENLINLRSLYLYGNQLTGSIPSEIGNLAVLQYLYLNGNQFSGAIPTQIGNLTQLKSLSLQQNQLTGTIPSSIGNLSNLNLFIVGNNSLEGEIPESLFNLTALNYFHVNNNQLSGEISTNIENFVNVQSIYLNGNQFSGDVPPINGLNNLVRFLIHDNEFENLPDLSGLTNLSELNAEDNYLTFEDIESNIAISDFTYVPQGKVGEEINYNVVKGNSYTMSVDVGGTANTYRWYKDGVEIVGTNSNSYIIDNFTESDVATYHCEINSTIVTDLTLLSNNINLGITVGLITIDASGNSESNTCTISGVVSETDFQTNTTYSFAPEAIPGNAQLILNSATQATKTIRFNIDENYNITDVQIEVGGNYIPLYNDFYSIIKIEENLHSTLILNQIEEICVYYPD